MIRNDVPKVKFSEMDQLKDFDEKAPSEMLLPIKLKEEDIYIDDTVSQKTITKKMKTKFVTK